MPPKKPSKRSRASKKKSSSRKGSSRKRAPKKKSATSRASRQRRSWKWVLFREGTPIALGAVAGLALTGAVLWKRANGDVAAFLADPPRALPTVVWSAPIELRTGQQASTSEIAGDLLAAGYEHVDELDGPDQFRVDGATVQVWSAPYAQAGVELPEVEARITAKDGRITSTHGAGRVVLKPTVLATLGDLEAARTSVHLDEVSPWVEPAVLAMEDRRFREHAGVDPLGIARALVHNLVRGGRLHGGSTLTQQLAKNLFLTQERTIQRKVRETFFAAALEAQLDKDRLLETYLSEVYLGQVGGVPIHGVEQAARGWFGISASRLSLPQAATIAGVIASPNTWSPVRHPDRAVERRDIVLQAMVETGAITEAQAAEAREAPLEVGGTLADPHRRAPWAVDVAIDALESHLDAGGPIEGWHVHSHLQPLWQRAAERAVAEGMAELDRNYPKAAGAQVALVAVRVSDGAVVALVGGRDYATSPFNRATRAWRQAGSTVKPVSLLAAFDADPDLTPISVVVDEPITRTQDGSDAPWEPRNYDGRYEGDITLREAIEHSRNVPAVKIAEEVGLPRLQGFARDLGLSRATAWHSAALGAYEATPWEMAGAYTVFPGGGTVARPWLFHSAVQPSTGEHLARTPEFSVVASARAAALATAVLQGVITDGTGARARRYGVDAPAGGKTGTTDDYRDAWFVGFTPELAVAVWVGNDQGDNLGLSGSRAALPTWSRFVVASGTLGPEFPVPEGIVTEPVCRESHQLARPACPTTYDETFAVGHVPKGDRCEVHGSPLVKVGGFFGKLFGKDEADVQGAPEE